MWIVRRVNAGWIVGVLFGLFSLGNVLGCAIDKVLSSGPDTMAKIASSSETITLHALDGLQASTGNVSVSGDIRDPVYTLSMFVGSGVLFDLKLGLSGIGLEGDLIANLEKRLESDPELRSELIKILHNTELSEAEQQRAIIELIRSLLTPRTETDSSLTVAVPLGAGPAGDGPERFGETYPGSAEPRAGPVSE